MPNRWFTSPAFVVSHRRAAHVHRSFNTLGIPEVTMKENPLDPRFCPKVVDIIPPGALASIGILTAVPVVDVYRPADQRKWCKAVLDWMDDEVAPANGCPTDDLLADGACRRSPTCGKCLLLLPFTHPEWEPALRHIYDPNLAAIRWRDRPKAPPVHRAPLTLEEVER